MMRNRFFQILLDAGAVVLALSFLSGSLFLLSLPTAYAAEAESCDAAAETRYADQSWRFDVYVDDKPIGCHHYYLDREEGVERLVSIADFEYRLLFVKLYDYEHRNDELWQDGCLVQLDSTTDDNGDPFSVTGRSEDAGFSVSARDGATTLPNCVRSFAYWNPELLSSGRLLNSQTGEYMEATLSGPEPAVLESNGQVRDAVRYELRAGELNLALWYSPELEWLALESETESGRVLRYLRQQGASTPVAAVSP